MRIQLAVFVGVGAAVLALSHTPIRALQGSAEKTTWDGVYSQAQAAKGDALYNEKCSKCHGSNGAGGDAPMLVGAEFASNWDDLTVDQLFDRIKSSMPQDSPGSLSREEAAALVAFIFQKNSFPTGGSDLSAQGEYLHMIKYKANKP